MGQHSITITFGVKVPDVDTDMHRTIWQAMAVEDPDTDADYLEIEDLEERADWLETGMAYFIAARFFGAGDYGEWVEQTDDSID